jgi:DNA-directed RNA polymerase subunit alpha
MEIQIEKGVGYRPRELKKKTTQEKIEIGVIPLDCIFTPVRRVAYRIENMRVGERTDFDKLTMEVETDGTINPEDAFFQASEILVKHFSLFADTFKKPEKILPAEAVMKVEEKKERKNKKIKKYAKKKIRKKTK